jgi:hypothetical protein
MPGREREEVWIMNAEVFGDLDRLDQEQGEAELVNPGARLF